MSDDAKKDEGKKKTSTGKKVLYGVIGFFVLIAMMKACGGSDKHSGSGTTTAARANAPAIEISASDLIEAYKANEVAADDKYKGKELIVEGRIDNIGKDILDHRYVAFKSGGQFEFREVQCMFGSEHNGALASLSKGQALKIRGECRGMMGNVLLDDCAIVPDAPAGK